MLRRLQGRSMIWQSYGAGGARLGQQTTKESLSMSRHKRQHNVRDVGGSSNVCTAVSTLKVLSRCSVGRCLQRMKTGLKHTSKIRDSRGKKVVDGAGFKIFKTASRGDTSTILRLSQREASYTLIVSLVHQRPKHPKTERGLFAEKPMHSSHRLHSSQTAGGFRRILRTAARKQQAGKQPNNQPARLNTHLSDSPSRDCGR